MLTDAARAAPTAPDYWAIAGRSERARLRIQRIPFRVRVTLVTLAILALLSFLFLRAGFDIEWILENAGTIVRGVWVTIVFSLLSIVLAVLLGLVAALGRISSNPIAYAVSSFYSSFIRGTPLILQLFLWYLALPQLANGLFGPDVAALFTWPSQVAGVIGIGVNYGAYLSEVFRAGIESVPYGQVEAAAALGMSPSLRMRRIVLPQAVRIVIPPTANDFVAMMKDTALIGLLGTEFFWSDPLRIAQFLGRADFRNLEALVVAALVFWVLTIVVVAIQGRVEERLSRGVRRIGDRA